VNLDAPAEAPRAAVAADPGLTMPTQPRRLSRPERRRRLGMGGSRLARLILALNLAGLAILVVGALVLNEFSRGLVQARVDSLYTQGELVTQVIVKAAVTGDPRPSMNPEVARAILEILSIPRTERARLYDAEGRLIADTDVIADKVVERPLPPTLRAGQRAWPWSALFNEARREARAHAQERTEVALAMTGHKIAGVRMSENGGRLVSVSIPIAEVQQVLGVLTIEAGDVDRIVAAQRLALIPFILMAVMAVLASSLLLNGAVAEPIRRLSRAADSVRLSRARAISLPDIAARQDEVGDLARSLDSMTSALSTRMDAIERFAADVSHEIKNPLTSMRSALETLELAPAGPAREKLMAVLKQDVGRLNRLITDIANASRLDAELSRDPPRSLDLQRFLQDVVSLYRSSDGSAGVRVALEAADTLDGFKVVGREGPLGQVFRNLIDNARSFSPPDGRVRIRLGRVRRDGRSYVATEVEDHGPGIPAENLESIFQRFYTARPKGLSPGGAAFGGHSGLGLSIVRQIVEAHGGAVRAENVEGVDGMIAGARFTVELPAAPAGGAHE
jgi:two-component system, OmpR family, sensor histidine kinase ChvG